MSGRASSSLKKIERLYGLIETMNASALQEASALMHEAEAAIVMQQEAMQAARVEAHTALAVGDRERYAMAETGREVGGRRKQRLETLRQAREAAREVARQQYEASRIERGQIKTVMDAAAAAERVIADRRAQTVSDDRFLSRLRWNKLQLESE